MNDSPTMVPFEELIQSDLFTFHIGEDRHLFVAHSKAIAATSDYFKRLINGSLREAQTRSATLEDVDPDTFVRFLEYTYRGDYTSPPWTLDTDKTEENSIENSDVKTNKNQNRVIVSSGKDIVQAATALRARRASVVSGYGDWSNKNAAPSNFCAIPSTKRINNPRREQLSSQVTFNERKYILPDEEPSTILSLRCAPKRNTSITQDFASVFLAHASLYTFADMRMVHPLKNLVLHKLHKTLIDFDLRPERLGDVAGLAKYAYDHGQDRSEDGSIDALRDMVVNYIAWKLKAFGKHTGFRTLMEGGGEFAGDFWDIVSK